MGELGTSPSVSEDTSDIPARESSRSTSGSGATADGVLERPAPVTLMRFGGGPSSMISVASSGYSSSDGAIDESGESSIG